ncbi:MAG: hypothetical protein KAH07_06590 [Flavobacteriaceae bacterium]|nr:hypothetical protein [Flavobacteriaceae bacterium]
MRKVKLVLSFLVVALIFLSCGTSNKIADEWKKDYFQELKSEKILVIHNTPDPNNSKLLEISLVVELGIQGVKAVGLHQFLPDMEYKEKRTYNEIQTLMDTVKSAGFTGVIVTMLRDKDQNFQTTSGSEHSDKEYYPSHYGSYYDGFESYYGGVYGYGYGESYIPPSSTDKFVDVYLLETATYNLSLNTGDQLIGVVSVKVKDPLEYSEVTEKYVEIVVDQFEN